ncbi:AfsR/SARP family transcriptional regulator [Millisia brevis]|uniref:AfsR/SARP family transcriptional regulator n=1 Tax=Millisia brevis TaxID=264148 RepID=UPI001FDF3E00|nr:BTAD domain-containing putative transcriptional regulator [Millisia brevis]
MALPMHARRVLAYLSLRKMVEPDTDRGVLAERLWADATPDRSRASLRTAIWRIRSVGGNLLTGEADRVALADRVRVDVHDFRRRAERILAADPNVDSMAIDRLDTERIGAPPHLHIPVDLLPGWDEDWLILAREQLRLLGLHALEQSAHTLCASGRYPEAIDTILRVVDEEPLRESAQAVLIDAHLRAGHPAEAYRHYAAFARKLWDELGIRPSGEIALLVRGLPPAAVVSSR